MGQGGDNGICTSEASTAVGERGSRLHDTSQTRNQQAVTRRVTIPHHRGPMCDQGLSRLKTGLQLFDPKTITAASCRIPNHAESMESQANEGWALLRRPTKVAFDSGVRFQLAVFAQNTVPVASWKLTPRLSSGASRVPILRQLRV